MATKRATASKAAWAKARKLAEKEGITVREARSVLAKNPDALTKSKRKAAKKGTKTRKKTEVDFAKVETDLRKKYSQVITGTLKAHTNGPHKNRRTVEILCTSRGCKKHRTVATSDLFQVKHCVEHVLQKRREQRKKK